MYLVITRTFPPELGGMQNLMWGLARSLSKLNLIKVFADYHENHEEFDKSVSFSIERVSGMKLIRKYRKSYMINDYLDQNNKVECIIADHWKSLELIKTNKKKICLISSKEDLLQINIFYHIPTITFESRWDIFCKPTVDISIYGNTVHIIKDY